MGRYYTLAPGGARADINSHPDASPNSFPRPSPHVSLAQWGGAVCYLILHDIADFAAEGPDARRAAPRPALAAAGGAP